MTSTLTWLDYDPAQRERMNRVLRLFEEKGTVDQLGFGGVRDAFADRLFPGTSTIQTRLRYFLFVPWMYRELENRQVPSRLIRARAREFELGIVNVLRESGEPGVIGQVAGSSLKILPSSVYWAGLESWGIRSYRASGSAYHRSLDVIHQRRKRVRDPDAADNPGALTTWHPGLPDVPPDWPEPRTLELRREEAEFLRGRILSEHPRSLLALLARGGGETDVKFPWEHPDYFSFAANHKLLLHHARLFSEIKQGGALLYNLMLAQRKRWEEGVERYGEALKEWQADLDMAALESWDLRELWELTLNQGHTITHQTRAFIEAFVACVREARPLADHAGARQLIEVRERRLKGAHSRFQNARALEEWRGDSGLGRLTYRWPLVQTHLNDLFRGLARD